MLDDELADLVAVFRPMVKSHIRQTRNLLAFLARLDEILDDKTDSQGGTPGNGSEEKSGLG